MITPINSDWFNDLEKGDKVYVRHNGFVDDEYIFTTVKKITSKGYIRVEYNDCLFRNGYYRIDNWHGIVLVQYTPELEAKLKAKAHYDYMCKSINAMDIKIIEPENVQKIWDILNE